VDADALVQQIGLDVGVQRRDLQLSNLLLGHAGGGECRDRTSRDRERRHDEIGGVQPGRPGSTLGIVLTVAGAACCAVYTVITRRWLPTADSTAQVVVGQQAHALGFAFVLVSVVWVLGLGAIGLVLLLAIVAFFARGRRE